MTQHPPEAGFLYAYSGSAFRTETKQSIDSLRRCAPTAQIALISDDPTLSKVVDYYIPMSDPVGGYIDKVRALPHSPFTKTIFLDGDTWIASDPSPLFGVLDRFDIAAAYDPTEYTPSIRPRPPGVAIPEFNTGVIAYRRNNAVISLLTRWAELIIQDDPQNYPLHSSVPDQPAFLSLCLEPDCGISILALPDTWNFRTPYPQVAHGRVHILHGKGAMLPRIAKKINTTTHHRLVLKGLGVHGGRAFNRALTAIEILRNRLGL